MEETKTTNQYVLGFAFWSFLGFLLVQAVFALIANSQAMMADCEAMVVDALTYLFNMLAEFIKNRPFTKHEMENMSPTLRDYKREIRRLYLELLPPLVSVATLLAVTVYTIKDAYNSLFGDGGDDEEDDVNAFIMLSFSAANLLLDIVNMSCFSNAGLHFLSFDLMRRETASISKTVEEEIFENADEGSSSDNTEESTDTPTESTKLLLDGSSKAVDEQIAKGSRRISSSKFTPAAPHDVVNLNMCSAWTHVCADTMRSTAVLIAAGIAYLVPNVVSPENADAWAAIAVSIIILISLIPLLEGLCLTGLEIYSLTRHPPSFSLVEEKGKEGKSSLHLEP